MADVVITPANVRASVNALLEQVVAGGNITQGMPVYKDSVTGKYLPADANVEAQSNAVGIAINAAADGQVLVICKADPDFTPGFPSASGNAYSVSTNPGAIAPIADVNAAAGTFNTFLMLGKTGNKAVLHPTHTPTVT